MTDEQENNCGNCGMCIQETNKCTFHDRKVHPNNHCKEHELLETTEDDPEEETATTGKPDTRPNNHGNVDYKILKEMYRGNATLREMADHFGKKSINSVAYHIKKLIKQGEIKERDGSYKPRVAEPKMAQVEITEFPKPRITTTNEDLQFIKDLMDGAEKMVIHRKSIIATIEFKKITP